MQIATDVFGTAPDGVVDRYTLSNDAGMSVQILTLGGIIQTLSVPDRAGSVANVTLGFADLDGYLRNNHEVHFGAITGRYANRIARGQFSLDGVTYQIPITNGPNCLHGGVRGFGARLWSAEPIESGGEVSLRISRISADGEEGFPGTMSVAITYALSATNELSIRYQAETDRATVINLTNHAYFNLTGEGSGSVLDHEITLNASNYAPTDANGLPTGPIAPVAGTPFDLRQATAFGARIRESHPQIVAGHGYDHHFALDRGEQTGLALAAVVHDPKSGRMLTVRTTEPGVQLYTANFLKAELIGTSGSVYRQSDAFCLETQHEPDAPNRPDAASTVLRPGEIFSSETRFSFSNA